MRFRATVEGIPIFFRIIQAIEKLQKKCIIKFTENEMHIICNDDANEGGIQVWSVVKVESLFTNYRIQSNAENKITVSLSTEALLSALRSSSSSASSSSVAASILPTHDADELVMKLAKKNDQAVLSFEMLGVSRSGRKVRVAHDVRIDVMRPSEVDKLREPLCPEPDVTILFPQLQKMRTIVEKLRPLSDILALRANNSGKLQISISTDTVQLETQWVGCTNPSMRQAPDDNAPEPEVAENPDPEKLFSVHVSIRSFIKFLNSHVVSTSTIACICQNHCAILYVYIGDVADAGGVLTFYIPTVIDDV
ncbi:cell cycle checkpoint [Boletus reticuloceps]|uniref:Checkpoint protein n=1 Tax=Boletus reticuloceps TaxID=495285 RepID=A0A8I2YHC1_9AGAM|nr:cell cycle checkpoint [Boletus reticuloceps]